MRSNMSLKKQKVNLKLGKYIPTSILVFTIYKFANFFTAGCKWKLFDQNVKFE